MLSDPTKSTLCLACSRALRSQARGREEFNRKTPAGLLLPGEVWKGTSEGTPPSGVPAKPGHGGERGVTAQLVAASSQGVVRSVLKENKPHVPVCVYAQ